MTRAHLIARAMARGPLALAAALAACAATPGAAGAATAPLPASEYGLHEDCSQPAPGRAACMSVRLVPLSARARAHTTPLGAPARASRAVSRSAGTLPQEGLYGLRPQDLHSAYLLPATVASTQTIAIVDAYNDPNAEKDLREYDETFALPACTTANGCFHQVNQSGSSSPLPFPRTNAELETAEKGTTAQKEEAAEAEGWALEVSLDIETARAVCQSCHILLVEAKDSLINNLSTAERSAETLGANEISNSWGAPELPGESPEIEAASAFNHPGTVITASAGDAGYLSWKVKGKYAEFPAASPHVVAVGGTQLKITEAGAWEQEIVWNGKGAGGGGCSQVFAAPAWQLSLVDWSAVGCGGFRSVADVAAVADPFNGSAVHDSGPGPECTTTWESEGVVHLEHWCTVGGTSLSSPLIAAVFALAGGAHGVAYPAQTLYENAVRLPASLHDVKEGSNGECTKAVNPETGRAGCTEVEEAEHSCAKQLRCWARAGYDGPSGLGTPAGLAAFQPPEEGSHSSEETGHGGGGGSEPPPPAPPAPPPASPGPGATPPPATPGPSPSGAGTPAPLRISALRLAPRAAAAIRRGPLPARMLAFTFRASAAGLARASVWRRARRHGRMTWVRVSRTASLNARSGANSARLATAPPRLARGVYRLTLAPAGGAPVTLAFTVA